MHSFRLLREKCFRFLIFEQSNYCSKNEIRKQKIKTEMKFKKLYLLLFTAVMLVMAGCKTTKNKWNYRWYHNVNARYNGYYYSRENMKEAIKKVETANKENYTKLLPIWVYPDNKTAKSFYADFDKSIKKSSSCIQRHCITDKNKKEIPNACKWIDENYMLIGKAHFYKRDLFSGLEAFEYVSKIYKNPNAKYNGMLWMMHADNEIGSYSLSEEVIDEIRNAKDVPTDRTFQKEYALVTADLEIKQGEYASAIRDLEKGISLTKKKAEKGRYTYVLAQLYEKVGDTKNASVMFGKVPPLHPNYEMEFNAKINQARLFDAENGDSKLIKQQLTKMLKDDKNIDYRDQIYFAFANIAYREKDMPATMDYLNKSIKASTTNTTQKALSYLKRGDIYFDQTNYKGAESNYDTTMQVLPKDYPDYAKIDEKQKSLSALVLNLKVIEMEDSLQTLARMNEKERNGVIDKMIARIEEEEKAKEEAKQEAILNAQNAIPDTKPGTTVGGGAQNGSWYFYNPATVSFGAGEFIKKWGSRKLEDDWNRADKSIVQSLAAEGNDTTGQGGTKDVAVKGKNKKDRDFYLKKIPLTPEALAKSDIRITDAYYNAGTIYKEQILNNKKSVETLEELLKRFPENKYKLSCYYQLYRTYLAMNNQQKSDYYKNIILNDYSDTQYAQIIRDPGKAKDLMASKSEVEMFYTGTYGMYTSGRYAEALANCQKAETDYARSALISQFAFIKALCIGRTQDINAFEAALQQVVIKYPKNEVKAKAQDILDAIKKQKASAAAANKVQTDSVKATVGKDSIIPEQKFVFKEDGEYYWVMVWDNGKGNINNFKVKLSNATTESFGTQDLSISSIFLDLAHQIITVKTLDGKAEAMNYYNFFKDRTETYTDLQEGSYQTFIISAENYTTFYKDKNVNDYQEFFAQNYQ